MEGRLSRLLRHNLPITSCSSPSILHLFYFLPALREKKKRLSPARRTRTRLIDPAPHFIGPVDIRQREMETSRHLTNMNDGLLKESQSEKGGDLRHYYDQVRDISEISADLSGSDVAYNSSLCLRGRPNRACCIPGLTRSTG